MIYRLSNIMRSNDNGHDDDEDDPRVSTSWHVVWAVLWARLPAAMIGYKSMWALLIIMIIVIIITEQQERVPPAPCGEGGPHERPPARAGWRSGRQSTRAEAEEAGPRTMKAYFCQFSLFHFHFSTFNWDVFASLWFSIGLTKDRERSETVATNQHILTIH